LLGLCFEKYLDFKKLLIGKRWEVRRMLTERALDTNDVEVEGLYDKFLEIIVNGSGYKGIADLLAQKLQASILIEDEYFCVHARSHFNKTTFSGIQKKNGVKYWKPQYADPRIINYVRLVKSSDGRPVELPELPEYGIKQSRLVFPVIVKNEIKAFLNVFKKDLNWYQIKIIRVALYSLVVLETFRKVQVELEEKIKKNQILDLISNDNGRNKSIHREWPVLGFDLSRETVLAVIQIKAAPGQQQVDEVLRSVISDLDLNANAIAINDEQVVLLVQPVNGEIMESELVTESLQAIYEALKMIFPHYKVRVGVGRRCLEKQDYKVAFKEACRACSFTGYGPGSEEGVFYYHSLQLMEILMQSANRQNMTAFVKRVLGKLHEYSMANNINLIESLECYFKHNCVIQSAARELFIHPNTLRYRIEKAERISGLNLADNDTKLEIQLALKLYRYQGESCWKNLVG